MRVYLSGRMRGLPNSNLKEFARVGELLNGRGYNVLNPADTRWGVGGARAEYLREDVTMLLIADAVVVLPEWEKSPGARLEVAIAWSFEIPVFIFSEHKNTWFLLDVIAAQVSIPSETNKHPLVGLCGYAQSGKDTFANALLGTGQWTRVAFADPLKDVALSVGWDGQKDDGGRKFLQDLGVGVRKHLFTDLWVQKAEEIIDQLDLPVVITDARFPNELEMIRRRGGILIWIARPGVGPINAHASEHSVHPGDCDYVVQNTGTISEMQEMAPELVADLIQDRS